MYDELLETLALFAKDPLSFAQWAFPWGEPGTELENDELVDWQIEILEQLRDGLININQAIRLARTSGHGIGKSALIAIIVWWAMSTCVDTKGVVTANTENQLKTKTWVEIAKWHRLFIAKDLFKLSATKIVSADPLHEDTWRFDMVPWSERNTEAFAGLHNKGKRIILIFDEGSAIPDVIWEVAEGALTDKDTEIIWVVFGNPTKNKGRFRECFPGGRFSHRWKSRAIDSRTVPFSNKEQIAEWLRDWGEDSDFFRVRVRGVFPRVDAESFISFELATEAVGREVEIPFGEPVVLGVDVARLGDDFSVIYPRCGRDASSREVEVYQGLNTMQLVAKIVAAAHRHQAQVIYIDSGGVGGGVVDRLNQLMFPVIPVDFGSGADNVNNDGVNYANKRAEIWGAMKNWLSTGSIVSSVKGLEMTMVDELTAPNYGLVERSGIECILLESKKDMRRRRIKSPNLADALAVTFAIPFTPRIPGVTTSHSPVVIPDYDPLSMELN